VNNHDRMVTQYALQLPRYLYNYVFWWFKNRYQVVFVPRVWKPIYSFVIDYKRYDLNLYKFYSQYVGRYYIVSCRLLWVIVHIFQSITVSRRLFSSK